jgi:prostamide/prostaglandin F2alpha synthase
MARSFAAALADITLPDSEGREIRLGSLWDTSPAVLAFLRHYG